MGAKHRVMITVPGHFVVNSVLARAQLTTLID